MSSDIKDILQCVNCGIKLNHIRRQWVADESEESRQLLTDWICKELEDNEVLCIPCYSLLHSALESENKSRRFGYKTVCLSCGMSLKRTRKSPILDEHPQHKLIVTQWIPSHQVKRLKFACRKCYRKAKRWYEITNSGYSKASKEDKKIKVEHQGYDEVDNPASSDSEESSEEEEIPVTHPQPSSFTINPYKRAADTSSRCIFKACVQTDMLAPPKSIKERLLVDYYFYLPPHSRMCEEHRVNSHEAWRSLVDSATITKLTIAHILNIVNLLRNCKRMYFCRSLETKIKQDDYLCQYLLGITYKKFDKMLKDIKPIRQRVWNIQKALFMYLVKKHTGFSAKNVAKFFGVRLKMVVKITNWVHKHLETLAATDDSYAAVPVVGVGNREEIVYYRI